MGNGRRERRALTRRDFDAVIRRASELAAAEPAAGEGEFTEAEVIRIAREAGLPERHIRSALAEVRAGQRVDPGRGREREGGPIRASRVIERSRAEIVAELQARLDSEKRLRRVRRRSDLLHYLSTSGGGRQLRLDHANPREGHVSSASAIEVRLEAPDPESTEVELRLGLSPLESRGLRIACTLGVGFAVPAPIAAALIMGGVSVLTTLAVATTVAVAAAAGYASFWSRWARKTSARRHVAASLELEGLLDSLEIPGGIEPPPPAWRRWLQRHFMGIAQDLFPEDGDSPRRSGQRKARDSGSP